MDSVLSSEGVTLCVTHVLRMFLTYKCCVQLQVRLVFEKQWMSAGLQPSAQPAPKKAVEKDAALAKEQATNPLVVEDPPPNLVPVLEDTAPATDEAHSNSEDNPVVPTVHQPA